MFVGWLLGLGVSLVVAGRVAPQAWWISPIAGFLITVFVLGPVIEIAYGSPRMRHRIDELAFATLAIVPGVATAAITIAMSALNINF